LFDNSVKKKTAAPRERWPVERFFKTFAFFQTRPGKPSLVSSVLKGIFGVQTTNTSEVTFPTLMYVRLTVSIQHSKIYP
jgi:hypothetical protein